MKPKPQCEEASIETKHLDLGPIHVNKVTLEHPQEVSNQYHNAYGISNPILESLRWGDPLPGSEIEKIFDLMIQRIRASEINLTTAGLVFRNLEAELKNDADSTYAIERLNWHAVQYFIDENMTEFKGADFPEIVRRTETIIDGLNPRFDKYLHQALTFIKTDFETKIERKKKEVVDRQAMFNNLRTEKEKPGSREKRQTQNGLNEKVATLLIYYLFKGFNISVANAHQSDLIELLTGYSKKQTIKLYAEFEKRRLEVTDGEQIDNIYFKNMKTARKRFEMIGLADICKLIDRDLGEEI